MIRDRSGGQKMAKSAGRFLILHLILPDQSIVDNTHFIFEVDGIMPLCSNGSETIKQIRFYYE